MTTQSLRGMANHGPMHWRGDRTGGNDPGGDALDEDQAFKKFIVAFDGPARPQRPDQRRRHAGVHRLHPAGDVSAEPDPQPRQLAHRGQRRARHVYFGPPPIPSSTATAATSSTRRSGFFGTDGFTTFENETQMFKIAHLRNVYQKVGMFGMPQIPFIRAGDNGNQGPQVRGFGFLHDGSIDTLFRFLRATVFSTDATPTRGNLEQFMFAFDSNLAPIVGQQITLTIDQRRHGRPAHRSADRARRRRRVRRGGEGHPRGRAARARSGWRPDSSGPTAPARPLLTDAQVRALAATAGPGADLHLRPAGQRHARRHRPRRGRILRSRRRSTRARTRPTRAASRAAPRRRPRRARRRPPPHCPAAAPSPSGPRRSR